MDKAPYTPGDKGHQGSGMVFYMVSSAIVSVFINGVTVSAILRATDLHAAPWQLGVLGSSLGAVYGVSCLLFGKCLGHVSPKAKFIAAASIYTVASFALTRVDSFWPLWTAVVMGLGLGGALLWPTIEQAICEGCSKLQIRRNLGAFSVSWSAGVTVGTFVVGPLYRASSVLPFYVFVTVGILMLAAFSLTPSLSVNPPARLLGNREDLQEEVPPGLSNKFLFLARLIDFLAYVSVSNLRALFPKQGI